MTLADHIRRYMELTAQADELFAAVERLHGDLMPCKVGCNDCCSVYFELSLIEAFTISGMFRQNLPGNVQERCLSRSEMVEPLFHQAGSLMQTMDGAKTENREERAEAAARLKIPCPLNEDGSCVLYQHRPITCRIYGTPQQIGDRVVSCPRTGFEKGAKYQTVHVETIHRKLYEYSCDLLFDLLGVKPLAPPGPLFILPAVLRTNFDKEFFLSLGKAFEKKK
jgi:Fe-S-cluster containining protein